MIKLAVFDNDGTMTDGNMIYDHRGNVSKKYLTKDCTALWLLQYEAKIQVLVLTGSTHSCDVYRYNFLSDGDFDLAGHFTPSGELVCSKAKAKPVIADHLIQGVSYMDKANVLEEYIQKRGIKWEEVAYFGDDRNDLPPMKKAGHIGCPLNAHDEVRATVMAYDGVIALKNGGEGAVAEFAKDVMEHNEFERMNSVR